MATRVSICSNALLSLGSKAIHALDPESDSDIVTLATNLYETRRDALLRMHPWNCCIKRVILSPDSSSAIGDYSYQFTLPADCLRVLSIADNSCDFDYRLEGEHILANSNTVILRYVFKNEVESTWDAMLVQAMELCMASAMAYAITSSTTKEQFCEDAFQRFLRQAKNIDGTEEPAETLGDFPLLASRY